MSQIVGRLSFLPKLIIIKKNWLVGWLVGCLGFIAYQPSCFIWCLNLFTHTHTHTHTHIYIYIYKCYGDISYHTPKVDSSNLNIFSELARSGKTTRFLRDIWQTASRARLVLLLYDFLFFYKYNNVHLSPIVSVVLPTVLSEDHNNKVFFNPVNPE